MKNLKLILIAFLAFSSTYAIDITVRESNIKAVERLSADDDIDIVVLNPYWECGPCMLYRVYEGAVNDDDALNALTAIGKIFNREVSLNTIEVSDEYAKSLGLTGYPTTFIFKEGKYLGEYRGAISLTQLAEAIDRLDQKNKYERRANIYLNNL